MLYYNETIVEVSIVKVINNKKSKLHSVASIRKYVMSYARARY